MTAGSECVPRIQELSIELVEELGSPSSDDRFTGHGDHLPLGTWHGNNGVPVCESWHVGVMGGIV